MLGVPPQEANYELSKRSRSFSFASLFLSRADRRDIEVLYRFLRWVDDLVDEEPDKVQAQRCLTWLLTTFEAADTVSMTACPREAKEFLHFCVEKKLPKHFLIDFLRGQESDARGDRIESKEELLHYCYRVAGTVGLMMILVLDASNNLTRRRAMDLGVAMQLTNIARDVRDDALAGRFYLPAEVIPREVILSAVVDEEPSAIQAVDRAVVELLALSKEFYRSADVGLFYLPGHLRTPLTIAGRVYEAIGDGILQEIASGKCGPVFGRYSISAWRKLKIAGKCFFERFFDTGDMKPDRDSPSSRWSAMVTESEL